MLDRGKLRIVLLCIGHIAVEWNKIIRMAWDNGKRCSWQPFNVYFRETC